MLEEEMLLNLIPTNKLYYVPRVLNGSVALDELFVGFGDGVPANAYDPKQLESELGQLEVDEIQFAKKSDDIYLLKINIPREFRDHVKEIGLYYKQSKKDTGSLIAYYHQEVALYDPQALVLQLILPHFPDDEKLATDSEEKNNETISGSSMPSLSAASHLPIMHAPDWFERKFTREIEWKDEGIQQLKIDNYDTVFANESVATIAAAFNQGTSIFLLYKGISSSNFYLSVFDVKKVKFERPRFLIEVDGSTELRNGIFGRLKQREARCYLSHPTGVFCFTIDLAVYGFKTAVKQQYHPAVVPSNATLANVGDNACLVGGSLANNAYGLYAAGTAIGSEGNQCMWIPQWLSYGRDNPLVEYWNGQVYFIGGNRNTSQPAIEVKSNFVHNITYTVPVVQNTFPNPINSHYLKEVNAKTHRSCRLKENIYIFPINLFKEDEGENSFYIYDTFQQKVHIQAVPEDIVEQVQEKGLAKYKFIQVVALQNRLIYFILTHSTHTRLKQQFIYADIQPD